MTHADFDTAVRRLIADSFITLGRFVDTDAGGGLGLQPAREIDP